MRKEKTMKYPAGFVAIAAKYQKGNLESAG